MEGQLPVYSVGELLAGRRENGRAAAGGAGELDKLVQQSRALAWGGSVLLEYYPRGSIEGQSRKAEVLVASSSSDDDDAVFSILFLRPADHSTSSASTVSPPTSDAPTSNKTLSPPTSPSLSESLQTPLDFYASTLQSGKLFDDQSTSDADSSTSRRRQRPATGDERKSRPHTAAVTDVLYRIAGKTRPHVHSATLDIPSPRTRVSAASSPSTPTTSSFDITAIPSPSSAPPARQTPTTPTRLQTAPRSRSSSPPRSAAEEAEESMRLMKFVNASAGAHRYQMSATEEEAKQAKVVSREDVEAEAQTENGAAVEKTHRAPLPFQILSDLVDTLPVILFLSDASGQIMFFNQRFYDHTGLDSRFALSPEEWTGCVLHLSSLLLLPLALSSSVALPRCRCPRRPLSSTADCLPFPFPPSPTLRPFFPLRLYTCRCFHPDDLGEAFRVLVLISYLV